jgi:enterobactin synthetase component D
MTTTAATATLPITTALQALQAGFDAALPGLFRDAPHPPVASACGVALDLAGLARLVSPERAAALVPPELARAIGRRQMSFIAGRLCAEEALRRLGRAGGVGRGRAGEPLWPAHVVGSITHTDRLACALVASAADGRAGMGIDSEQIDDEASLQAVLSVCCTPRERVTLFAGDRPPHEERVVATIVFALKEAFYKAIHPAVGRFVDFDELEVHALDRTAGRAGLRPCLPELAMDSSLAGRFNVIDGAVHAVVHLRFEQAR